MRPTLIAGFVVLLSLPAASAPATGPAPGAVQPLGIYSRVSATADHTYGHEIRLWRVGNRLVGQMTYWNANPEGERGRFDDGAIDQQTGEINFSVTVTRHDVQPNIQSRASFRGRLTKDALAGALRWDDKDAEARGTAVVEKLDLPIEKGARLAPYPNVGSWRKAD